MSPHALISLNYIENKRQLSVQLLRRRHLYNIIDDTWRCNSIRPVCMRAAMIDTRAFKSRNYLEFSIHAACSWVVIKYPAWFFQRLRSWRVVFYCARRILVRCQDYIKCILCPPQVQGFACISLHISGVTSSKKINNVAAICWLKLIKAIKAQQRREGQQKLHNNSLLEKNKCATWLVHILLHCWG